MKNIYHLILLAACLFANSVTCQTTKFFVSDSLTGQALEKVRVTNKYDKLLGYSDESGLIELKISLITDRILLHKEGYFTFVYQNAKLNSNAIKIRLVKREATLSEVEISLKKEVIFESENTVIEDFYVKDKEQILLIIDGGRDNFYLRLTDFSGRTLNNMHFKKEPIRRFYEDYLKRSQDFSVPEVIEGLSKTIDNIQGPA